MGTRLNFRDAVPPAKRLVELYLRLAPAALQDFPLDKLQQVLSVANENYNLLSQVLNFNPEQGNPHAARQSLIQQISSGYPNTFNILHPLIAYSLHRSADFQRLDRDARATLQDRGEALEQELEGKLKEAERIVGEVRQVAAETGVSQQASYFKAEADSHEKASEQWRSRTVRLAWLLAGYGF